MNVKNAWVSPGGVTRHTLPPSLAEAGRRGLAFELFSPLRSDLISDVRATWHPIVPGTDTAVMLALAHTLITDGLHDPTFLERYCVGGDRLIAYVMGEEDGVAKDPVWAERMSGIAAETIRDIAHRMAEHRTLVTVSWALQRTVTASNRCGWASRSRRCSARSACRAAGSVTATARWPTSVRPRAVSAAGVLAGSQPRRDVHSGRADQPPAREPRRHARLRRPPAAAARHPPRVLGRRQPVPPSPGPQPLAPRARAARHRRRARAVLDGDGPPRRHRAARRPRPSSATTWAPAATTAT